MESSLGERQGKCVRGRALCMSGVGCMSVGALLVIGRNSLGCGFPKPILPVYPPLLWMTSCVAHSPNGSGCGASILSGASWHPDMLRPWMIRALFYSASFETFFAIGQAPRFDYFKYLLRLTPVAALRSKKKITTRRMLGNFLKMFNQRYQYVVWLILDSCINHLEEGKELLFCVIFKFIFQGRLFHGECGCGLWASKLLSCPYHIHHLAR